MRYFNMCDKLEGVEKDRIKRAEAGYKKEKKYKEGDYVLEDLNKVRNYNPEVMMAMAGFCRK